MTGAQPAWRGYSGSAVESSPGVYTVTVPVTAPALRQWTVTQIAVEMPDAPFGSQCEVRVNDLLVAPAVPTRDALSGEPPIVLKPSDTMDIIWRAVNEDSVGTVTIFFVESPY